MAIERVKKAIEALKRGEIIIMIDDEDRENEGDLVYASTFSTPEKVNFLATYGKGLICVALSEEIAERFELVPMVSKNTSSYETAFTISVDAKEATTGISAIERDMTIKILADPLGKAEDLVRPGHIFPLIAKNGGTLRRTGHTEGSVDLCRLAGLQESAVICEIMKDDGEMARRKDLLEFAEKYNLRVVYISDIVEYRLQNERLISLMEQNEIEMFGVRVKRYLFKDHLNRLHTAIQFYSKHSIANVKFHHVGLDVDLLTNSKKYSSLVRSIEYLKQNGGVLVFLDSSNPQENNIREFGIGAQILKELGVNQIRLITSQSKEIGFIGIHGFSLDVVEEIAI
ncbi:MAG TPA: bifunctional 3,4-dihydroxy-2-butanone 4-phosphate synthase/GTP cyclohydrolase II [Campylobacterales bacterium]|nr:bifunctional 3,4-dihydroxy-2-butanone 4-phosphate synthase/GTP cyclohydrolase II [Campylobacterales bacterium]HIO70536.1 bifunctional 3,4-dihydroxy-2-butanone 4-phosphate synthase/GTP cyclohydrolase II [Campylobacterales bacterium]